MTKKKFRTLYDTQGYKHETITGDESPTDPSEYIPTETLVQRFLRGDILSGISYPEYEFTDDITDIESVDRNFDIADEQEDIKEKLKNHGADTLKRTALKLQQKMSEKSNQQKAKVPEKPTRSKTEAEPEAEGEGADKPVKPGASEKQSSRREA